MRTILLQEMLRRAILINYLAPSFAHGEPEIGRTIEAARESLVTYRRALEEGWPHHLVGAPIKPVFRAFNGGTDLE